MKKLKRFFVTAIVSAMAITMSAQSADTVKKGRIIDSATGKATEVALPYNPVDDVVGPYYIEREKAIEIAMSQFGNSASCDYYASWSGSKLITDPRVCYADDIPDGGGWVRSGYHWLIFVDEAPTKSWEHECSYVYVECEVPSIKVAPKCCVIRGKKPTYDVCGFEARSAVNRYGAKANLKPSVAASGSTYNSAVGGRTYALIMDCASDVLDNFERCWNDCSFIYQTLHKKYNVPKDNISVIIGTDEYDTFMRKADGSGFTNNSHDFDFDGVAEMTSPLASEDLDYELLYRIKKIITKQDQLLIFITGNGGYDTESGRYYAQMYGNNRLYADELALKLDEIEARSVCIVLGQSFAGGFAKELEGKGRVICAGCGTSEAAVSCRDIPYTEFLYRWTSAMNQADAEGSIVAADTDNNGRVTVEEAFNYAKRQMSSTTPTMASTPLYIQEDMAFNNIPEAVDLYIRDDAYDTGKEPNVTDVFWNSPDIWVRNQNDGRVNQESENIKLDTDDEFKSVYVYVKVRNRGQDAYPGRGLYLHLYWTNLLLNYNRNYFHGLLRDSDKNSFGSEIYPEKLRETILPGDSLLVALQVQLPKEFVEYYRGNKFASLNFLARISESESPGTGKPIDVIKGLIPAIKQSNNMAQSSRTKITDYVKQDLTVYVIPDSLLCEYSVYSKDAEVFKTAEVSLELSSKVYNSWQTNGSRMNDVTIDPSNPRKFYFKSAKSSIGGISVSGQTDSIKFSYRPLAGKFLPFSQRHNINIVATDAQTGEILAGTAIDIDPLAVRESTEPEIVGTLEDGTYHLTEKNMEDDASFVWTDADSRVVSKERTAEIDAASACGTYQVKTETADGIVGYASVELEKIPVIKSVAPNPMDDKVHISLSRGAGDSATVKIVGVTNPTIQKVYDVKADEKDVILSVSELPEGNYRIIYFENGKILGSEAVIK